MKLSRYFANLSQTYQAELDDLKTDSEGKNVLDARLAKKREQVPQLLMMLSFSPEMVAVAFHGGFSFKETLTLEQLINKEPNKFTAWSTLKKAILIAPWAQKLVDCVLTAEDGEAFLITTVGLEYLQRNKASRAASPSNAEELEALEQDENGRDDDDNTEDYLNSDDRINDEGESTEFDLDKSGADWLAEQGFDRKD